MGSSWLLGAGDEIVPGVRAERKLGGGERYEAYLGWHERLFAPVVVKVVRPIWWTTRRRCAVSGARSRCCSGSSHPVVVRSFDADPRGGAAARRPRAPGRPSAVDSLLRRFGPLALDQLLAARPGDVLGSRTTCRRSRVVHLDVKPSNIIMGSPPRLIDLSIARTA